MKRSHKERLKLYLKLAGRAFIDGTRTQIEIARELARLREELRARMPGNLALRGAKIYSQCDEDGILQAVFEVLGSPGSFIEIGCGDGLENNTHALLLRGWKGVWIDGSAQNVGRITGALGGARFGRLLVEQQFLDAENAASACARYAEFLGGSEPDLLSLDIDGNDAHVLRAVLGSLHPKVLCLEYNAKFPPPMKLVMDYSAAHEWQGDDYHGVALAALVEQLAGRYTLLTCTLSGTNSFFVRDDLRDRFPLYKPEDLYQPARYHLTEIPAGSRASLQWLRQVLGEPPRT